MLLATSLAGASGMCCVCPSGGAKLCSQGVGAEAFGVFYRYGRSDGCRPGPFKGRTVGNRVLWQEFKTQDQKGSPSVCPVGSG